MTRKRSNHKNKPPVILHKRAEALVRMTPADINEMSAADVQRLIHEVQIHQIELELQNEELRRAQVELAGSRDRYSDLYEFAPVGYLTLDKNGKILQSNLTAATMLGIERQSLLRANISKFVARESQDEWYRYRLPALATDTRQVCEIRMRKANGTPLTVQLESSAFGPENDRQCRATLIDISQRMRAEQSLREASKTLEEHVAEQTAQIRLQAKAIENLNEGVLITNGPDWPQSRILFVNEAVCRMTGYTAGELIGQPQRILRGSWADRDNMKRIRMELSAGNSYRAELVSYRKDGTQYDTEFSVTPLFDAAGRCTNFVSIHRNITERKMAEQALREREGRLQAILNTAGDAIITIDRRGIIVSANPATEQMFGYTQAELLGQNVKILMPSPYREEHDNYIARYLETGKSRIMGTNRETVGLRKNGSTFPVELVISEIAHLGLFTGIHRDITARKQAEEHLHQYRKDLRTMSLELMLTEARERQQLAQDLHDGLGQVVFRLRRKLDQVSIGDLDTQEINAILEEMAMIVNMLTFELSPPVLHELGLRPAIKWLATNIHRRYNLSVQVAHDGQPIPLSDRASLVLFRCIRELLINVAKHSQSDSARVSMQRSGGNLQVKIEDHGKGFDPANQSTRVEAGHFGLFSVRERLVYLGGTFQLQSAPGKGTTVTLTLPLAAKAAKSQTT